MYLLKEKKAHTLVEMLVAVFVGTIIFLAVWAVYVVGWTWWNEVAPRIEAQRVARLAVGRVIDGVRDSTSGYDVIGPKAYRRRNGIAAAYYFAPNMPNPQYDDAGHPYSNEIQFGLFEDYVSASDPYQPATANNVRSFYIGTDADGIKAVYYKDGNGVSHRIEATSGIEDLRFYQYYDTDIGAYDPKVIVVEAVAKKSVKIGAAQPYEINVNYCDYVYLRNVQ